MRILSNVVVLLSFSTIIACGGASAASKDADPWSDFSGKYAGTAEPRANASEKTAAKESARKDAKDAKSKPEAKEHAEEAAPEKKSSKATIHGTSISMIDDGALGEASKGALKTKLVGTTVATGAQYERVRVTLKGAVVTIIRPASTPNGNASVDAPKAKSGSLSKAEAGYYDEEADVLVVVETGGKKASAEKALGALVSR